MPSSCGKVATKTDAAPCSINWVLREHVSRTAPGRLHRHFRCCGKLRRRDGPIDIRMPRDLPLSDETAGHRDRRRALPQAGNGSHRGVAVDEDLPLEYAAIVWSRRCADSDCLPARPRILGLGSSRHAIWNVGDLRIRYLCGRRLCEADTGIQRNHRRALIAQSFRRSSHSKKRRPIRCRGSSPWRTLIEQPNLGVPPG
jgi:hypothetical protein